MLLMQLGHFDVNNAFEIIWDRVAKKYSCVRVFIFWAASPNIGNGAME